MSALPIGLDDLIHARAVESVRLEFKKTWNEPIRQAVLRTVCAFANDLQGLNGGYIVIGIEEAGGLPQLPPHGLEGLDIDRVQREIFGQCQRLDPQYQPVVSPEMFMGKPILVLYVPRGDARPYEAPADGRQAPFVRVGSATVEARGDLKTQLMQVAARVPFDDRRRQEVPVTAISTALVARFLADVGSSHAQTVASDPAGVLRSLKLTAPSNGAESPRNVALLFFTEDPEKYLPGGHIELAHFRDDTGGDLIESRAFHGPIDQQVRAALQYLRSLLGEVTRKVPGQAEAERFVAFPFEAMEEAVVNAVYHRGYDVLHAPVRIGLYPDRMEITSFPGPVPGIERKHFELEAHPPLIPARNPRVGEFLKSLRLAETWHTGVAKVYRRMTENGSPPPVFDFDEGRTYFRVTLPAHPGYVVFHAQREAAALWHSGEKERATARVNEALRRVPGSGALTAQLIEYASAGGDLALAEKTLSNFENQKVATRRDLPYMALARSLLDNNQSAKAVDLLGRMPFSSDESDAVELAILHKRSGQLQDSHRLFSRIAAQIQNDPRALHEFAQVKIGLAMAMKSRRPEDRDAKMQFNREAVELLRRVTELAADRPTRAAWAWFDLAQTLAFLREPESVVHAACETAIRLLPGEERFKKWLNRRNLHAGK